MKGDKMKKIVFVTVLVLFLVGCQTGELPPEPGDITGPIGKAVHIYEGYAPPNDVFDNNKMIFNLEQNVINIDVDEDNFTLNLEVSHDASFIYKYGYYYSKKGWQKYLFDSEPYKESNWIKDHAKKELNLQVDDFNAGENYIVAYSCKRHDGKWKCGCTSTNGPCNQWMLQTYLLLQDELPPEPPTPDDPYGDPPDDAYSSRDIGVYFNYTPAAAGGGQAIINISKRLITNPLAWLAVGCLKNPDLTRREVFNPFSWVKGGKK